VAHRPWCFLLRHAGLLWSQYLYVALAPTKNIDEGDNEHATTAHGDNTSNISSSSSIGLHRKNYLPNDSAFASASGTVPLHQPVNAVLTAPTALGTFQPKHVEFGSGFTSE
jgi:hypothetical protein